MVSKFKVNLGLMGATKLFEYVLLKNILLEKKSSMSLYFDTTK